MLTIGLVAAAVWWGTQIGVPQGGGTNGFMMK